MTDTPNHWPTESLDALADASPETAEWIARCLVQRDLAPQNPVAALWIADTCWALAIQADFGKCVARGYAVLIKHRPAQLDRYHDLIRKAGQTGPTFGSLMAQHAPPVLKHRQPGLWNAFNRAVRTMQAKGNYTLKAPLQALTGLLNGERQTADGAAYLALLHEAFALPLTYNQSLRWSHSLPRAVESMEPVKRISQIQALRRLLPWGHDGVEALLTGLAKRLHLLAPGALNRFVDEALEKFNRNPVLALKFLALTSSTGMDICDALQVVVPLSRVKAQLSRYLQARTGLPLSIKPLGAIRHKNDNECLVCSDSQTIYLADQIGLFSDQGKNKDLYRQLVCLEAGLHEFGTFDFDLEKALERCPAGWGDQARQSCGSDLERFWAGFDRPELAADLFQIFEDCRILVCLQTEYPGLVRRLRPLLRDRFQQQRQPDDPRHMLYDALVLASPAFSSDAGPLQTMTVHVKARLTAAPEVTTCAVLVQRWYPDVKARWMQWRRGDGDATYPLMPTPFGRRLRPDLAWVRQAPWDRKAREVTRRLRKHGIKIYKGDVRKKLAQTQGRLTTGDVQALVVKTKPHSGGSQPPVLSTIETDLADLLTPDHADPAAGAGDHEGDVYQYREWDNRLQDYLPQHTRVIERTPEQTLDTFYQRTLQDHHHHIARIRHAFELLRPQGLQRLRPWVEGDEFDYRALLDFAIDKRAGLLPSQRLYIKKLKQNRDVAVLLLVDLSRSTANAVQDDGASVLDIEKQAIVLFCEALTVVGDAFAIAGFSGSGRTRVDYFNIKAFEDPLDIAVKQRINALTPQRSTRMGAAVRHAGTRLSRVAAKTRILLVLGDGFPNDVGYKHQYAIDDTRKAIFELRAQNIHVRGITVNLVHESRLDDLYGHVHHNVICDVRHLPEKLLKIYSGLTHQTHLR